MRSRRSYENKKLVFTPKINKCWGTMDSFYIASQEACQQIANKYDKILEYAEIAKGLLTPNPCVPGRAEILLHVAIAANNLVEKDSSILFERVRLGGVLKGYSTSSTHHLCWRHYGKEDREEIASMLKDGRVSPELIDKKFGPYPAS